MPLPQENPANRVAGIGFVILLHIGVIYILSNALGITSIELMKGPIEATVIDEAEKPKDEEPPPPPPKFIPPPPVYVPPPEVLMDTVADAPSDNSIRMTTNTIAPPAPPPTVAKPSPTPPRSDPKHKNSLPDYPPSSKRLGEEGSCILNLYVLEDGKVAEAKVQTPSGFPKLDEAAVREALRRWRYLPATLDGKPVADWYQVKVTFKLTE